jgi:N-succinyldiaminopimelate aminotransferase
VVALAERHRALIVSDEVYEHIAFKPHVPVASRPGAWERTLTISSIGKTFSVTGWKVGWAVGPPTLITPLRRAHQWIPFAVATPLQRASGRLLREAPGRGYYEELERLYRAKRDLLVAQLRETPFRPLEPQGGYFVIADSTALGYEDDVALCNDLPGRVGVGAIPPSAFYSPAHKALAKGFVRLAFCKSDEALREAGRRLRGLGT